ncbi:hypothetical protein [Bradyrhizobium sp. YR681]|uniref:hypothetical protein n=1 Tax=Bradyrhizobium sp. YR681 TaxID=1144344 RepID=UPI00187227D0|nr:hypothetical protein [Bradyrhizobium sp. YR681]
MEEIFVEHLHRHQYHGKVLIEKAFDRNGGMAAGSNDPDEGSRRTRASASTTAPPFIA